MFVCVCVCLCVFVCVFVCVCVCLRPPGPFNDAADPPHVRLAGRGRCGPPCDQAAQRTRRPFADGGGSCSAGGNCGVCGAGTGAGAAGSIEGVGASKGDSKGVRPPPPANPSARHHSHARPLARRPVYAASAARTRARAPPRPPFFLSPFVRQSFPPCSSSLDPLLRPLSSSCPPPISHREPSSAAAV